jgi:hypothetical protein
LRSRGGLKETEKEMIAAYDQVLQTKQYHKNTVNGNRQQMQAISKI